MLYLGLLSILEVILFIKLLDIKPRSVVVGLISLTCFLCREVLLMVRK